MNEYHFIGIGIFIEIIGHAFPRGSQGNMQIAVDQNCFPAFQVIIFRCNLETFQAPRFQLLAEHYLGLYLEGLTHLAYFGRRI